MNRYAKAIAHRRGLIRARSILCLRRDTFREVRELIRRTFNNSAQEIALISGRADEIDTCADKITAELERLPKIRGKKWGRR